MSSQKGGTPLKLNHLLRENDLLPFHMPGHKRNSRFGISGSEIDITEIEGFDNLHNADGILKELEDTYSKLYSSSKSILSVNGSTCCVLSAVFALCGRGDKIIIARNCHRSVYNACLLNELEVTYIEPEFDEKLGMYTKVSQQALESALKAAPDAKAVVITSPTYEGVISRVSCDIPLIIDAAHGAHFGFADFLPEKMYGDIVINSLHKTLPALTQSAVIHIYNPELTEGVKKYMDIFETSSPSYVLLASADTCADFLKSPEPLYEEYKINLDEFKTKLSLLSNIHLYDNDDPTRLVVYSDNLSGVELAELLRREYRIEPEGATLNYVILISTVCDEKEAFNSLYDALADISKNHFGNYSFCVKKPPLPEVYCKMSEVKETEETQLENSVGKVSGEFIFAYPPGIPVIAPGEVISEELLKTISQMKKTGVNLISDGDITANIILTKKH